MDVGSCTVYSCREKVSQPIVPDPASHTMNCKASETLPLSSTSAEDDLWIPSIIIPLQGGKPFPYSESYAIQQRNAEIPIPQTLIQLKVPVQELLQDLASPLAENLKQEEEKIDIESKAFTGFTDAEKKESEKTVGIKSNILRNFYNRSAQKGCLGSAGNFLKVDKASHEASSSSHVNKCGIEQLEKIMTVDVGMLLTVSGAMENGDRTSCVVTTEDKVGEGEQEVVIPDTTSVLRSLMKTCSGFMADHPYSPFETDSKCEIKTEHEPNVLVREGTESSSESISSSSEDDDDYDWISFDDDGEEELYETGMLPPAYPEKALALVPPMSSGNSYLFNGCEEKDTDLNGDERANKEVTKSLENRKSMETGRIFGVSKMLASGSLDSALMRFQMNNSTDQFDDNVDKLLTSYSSDQSFQWNPIKKKPEGPSSEEVLSPKPITQCNNRCEKRECVECESLSTGSVTQPFICGGTLISEQEQPLPRPPPKLNMQCIRCKKYEYATGLSGSVIRTFICFNCVEFNHSTFIDLGAIASLTKPKPKLAAASNQAILKRSKRKRK